mgnify:CR=1 FL=1
MMGVGYRPPSTAPPPAPEGGEEFFAPAGGEFAPPLTAGDDDDESARQRIKRDMYILDHSLEPSLVEELPIPVITLRDSQLRQCAYVPAKVKYQGYCDDYESGMACVYQVSARYIS